MDGLTALWGRGIDLSDGISRIDHERITLLSGVFAHNRAFEVRCRFFRVQGLDDGWICDGLSGRFAPLVPANHSARLHDGERVTRATNPVASAPELQLGGQARALPPTTRDAEQASPSTKTGAQRARCLSSLLANHGSAFWGDYPYSSLSFRRGLRRVGYQDRKSFWSVLPHHPHRHRPFTGDRYRDETAGSQRCTARYDTGEPAW